MSRCDALKAAEEERDLKVASRVNPMDEELIKTKGLLRAPSARKESTIKRLSAEVKELREDAGKEAVRDPQSDCKALKEDKDSKDETPSAAASVSSNTETEKGNKDGVVKNNENMIESPGENEIGGPISCCAGVNQTTDDVFVEKKVQYDTINSASSVSGKDKTEYMVDFPVCDTDVDSEHKKVGLTLPLSAQMPDIAAEAVRSVREKSPESLIGANAVESEDTSSFSIVTSDSDQDSSADISSPFAEEAVKQGHVKGIIAKVTELSRSGGHAEEEDGDKVVGGSEGGDSVVVLESESRNIDLSGPGRDCGIEYDRVNQFITINRNIEVEGADGGNESKVNKEDEEYVAKSLPELAQVFEQGELKQKRRRKSEKEKENKAEKNKK